MKYIFSIFAFLLSLQAMGQSTCASGLGTASVFPYHDSIDCQTTSVDLHAVVQGDIPVGTGITVDDGYSGIIPIGFTFNFYGVPYTQCIIGSNGSICFNTALAGGGFGWSITSALLGNANVRNSVCGPWCDIYIPSGGTITTSTSGVAPYRRFTASWCHTAMYSCTTQWITTQIIIYETCDIAEVHVGHKTSCPWNGGYAIIGVQNAAGTVATAAPGRDYPAVYTCTNEAWRFTPAGPTYTVASIPYSPIPLASSPIYWYDSTSGAYLGTGAILPVAPVLGTTYKACVLGCDDSSYGYVNVPALMGLTGTGSKIHLDSVSYLSPSVCGKCDGSMTLYGIAPYSVNTVTGTSLRLIDTIIYSFNGVKQAGIIDSANVTDSTLHVSGLCAGTYNFIYVKNGSCPTNQLGPITLAPPPVVLGLDTFVKFGCYGDQVKLTDLSTPTGSEYVTTWNFGDGSPTSNATVATHIYTAQGIYTVHLTHSTVYGCIFDTSFTLTLVHPIAPAFIPDPSEVCIGSPIVFNNFSTANSKLIYDWNFDDGTHDTATSPIHYYKVGGDYTVQLTITDTIGCDSLVKHDVEVISIKVHTSVPDTNVCLVDSMMLHAFFEVLPKGEDTGISYAWTQSPGPGNFLGNPNISNPQFFSVGEFIYTVTATTNHLFCPATDTEVIHSHPQVVLANLTPTTTIPYGSSIQLNSDSALYYKWLPNNGTLNNNNINSPIATPVDSVTVYTVFGMNYWGCVDTATITIHLGYDMNEFMPSAFTPNGDGLNDVYRVTKLRFQKLVDFKIFNRFGQIVFQTSNPEVGWDGTYNGEPQDLGVYNYIITVAHAEGINKSYTGSVTLIR